MVGVGMWATAYPKAIGAKRAPVAAEMLIASCSFFGDPQSLEGIDHVGIVIEDDRSALQSFSDEQIPKLGMAVGQLIRVAQDQNGIFKAR